MPDTNEIKAKVIVEYDGSGLEEAKKDLASLSDLAGGVESSAGGASTGLAGLDEQAKKNAVSAGNLNDVLAELPKVAEDGGAAVETATEALQEHVDATEETTAAHDALQESLQKTAPAMQEVTASAQEMQKQIGTAAENAAVFQDALTNSNPFELVRGYLNDTGQTWSDFASSIGDDNAAILKSNQAFREGAVSFADLNASLKATAENTGLFQDMLVNPEPFGLLQGYLQDTGQTFDEFRSSLSFADQGTLSEIMTYTPGTQMPQLLSAMGVNAETIQSAMSNQAPLENWDLGPSSDPFLAALSNGPAATEQINNMNKAAAETNATFANTNKTANEMLQTTEDGSSKASIGIVQMNDQLAGWDHSLDESGNAALNWAKGLNEYGGAIGINQYGGGLSDWLSGQSETLFGAGGLMGMLNDVMMPMYALQMIPMMVSAVGSSIYNAAAIAEGPAAHSFGTFTGAIDTLTASAAKSGEVFSESFGQGLLPALNGMNNASQNSDNGFLGQLGQGLGMETGIAGDFLQIIGGGIVGGAAKILTLNPNNQFGQDWINSGTQGLANYWANWTGQPQPYPGPPPPNQAQTYYQQQMANLPNTIQMSTAQLQSQATTTLAEAADPSWEAAYNQASASQKAAQYLISNYQSRHPISQADLIQQAQYNDYVAQQEQNYQDQMNGVYAPGVPGPALPGGPVSTAAQQSSPLDFLTGFGPASIAGYQGTGGETYGQEIGQGIQDFFSQGAGGGIMQFLTGFGGTNTGGGQTYGQAIGGGISGFFGGIGAGISGFFGGLGQDLFGGGGGTSQPFQTAGGCFVAGTRVLMADGSEKPIELLHIGEQVRAHDGTKQVHATITDRITFPAKQTYRLSFSDGTVLLTTDSHPIATTQGWKSISPASTATENPGLPVTTLEVGDSIYTASGVTCRLISLQKHEITQVYNITVDTVHVYYANNILVHNAKGFTSGGEGSENVSLSHTFTATVTWAANNLEKSFTAAAQWAEQGLVHAATAVAQWAEQGLMHEATAVAQWAEQGLQHMATAVAQWAEQDLIHPATAAVQWAEQGLQHTATAVASWIGEGLEHTFNAVANWTAQNLTPNFTVNPSVTMLAEGTSNWSGGPAIVGEAGTEVVAHNGQFSLFDQGAALVNLPAGASVYPMKNLSYAPSTPAQFADGLGDGSIIPLNIGMRGSGAGMPETANIYLQIDGQTFWSATGISLAQNSRVVSGSRSF